MGKPKTPEARAAWYERKRQKKRAAKIAHLPPPTDHARERWKQRFRDDEILEQCYADSQPIQWREISAWANSSGLVLRLRQTSEYRYDATTGAVFVIDSDGGPNGGKELRTVVRIVLHKLKGR